MPSSNLVSECRNSIDILLMACNGIDLYYRSSFVVFLYKDEISDFGSYNLSYVIECVEYVMGNYIKLLLYLWCIAVTYELNGTELS